MRKEEYIIHILTYILTVLTIAYYGLSLLEKVKNACGNKRPKKNDGKRGE
jgi:hypothetical protein